MLERFGVRAPIPASALDSLDDLHDLHRQPRGEELARFGAGCRATGEQARELGILHDDQSAVVDHDEAGGHRRDDAGVQFFQPSNALPGHTTLAIAPPAPDLFEQNDRQHVFVFRTEVDAVRSARAKGFEGVRLAIAVDHDDRRGAVGRNCGEPARRRAGVQSVEKDQVDRRVGYQRRQLVLSLGAQQLDRVTESRERRRRLDGHGRGPTDGIGPRRQDDHADHPERPDPTG